MAAQRPAPDRLSDADALMWRIESDPVLRSPILAVATLGATPSPAEVTAAFGRAAGSIPRLHRRVVRDGPVTGRLRWEDDPDFHVEAHLRFRRLSGRAGLSAVLELAAEDAAAAFDPARPPWTATLVTGLRDRRSALVLRFHHSITDGVGGVQLADALFEPVDGRPVDQARGAGAVDDAGGADRRGPAAAVATVERAGRVALGAVRDPLAAGREAARWARSLGRLLGPATEPLSPIWRRRGIDRRLFAIEVPLPALRETGHRFGASINDVFLAALAGGLHAHHRDAGHEVPALRITMPVNRRSAGDAPGGNRFTPVRFVLPIDDPDPEQRVRIAGNIARTWRTEPAMGVTDLLAGGLNLLPDGVVTGVFAGMLRGVDVDAVDLPGLRVPVALAGAPVERLWAFAPPTGAAISVTLLSHLDVGCIAVAVDTAAVAEPDRLMADLERSVREMVDLAAPEISR